MTREEAQSVIMTEQKCVNRASTDRCNRDCANCDLIMDDAVINEAYNMAIKALEEPERKKGQWLDNYQYGYKCSECGGYIEIDCGDVEMNFCPNCGAYMRGEQK